MKFIETKKIHILDICYLGNWCTIGAFESRDIAYMFVKEKGYDDKYNLINWNGNWCGISIKSKSFYEIEGD